MIKGIANERCGSFFNGQIVPGCRLKPNDRRKILGQSGRTKNKELGYGEHPRGTKKAEPLGMSQQ